MESSPATLSQHHLLCGRCVSGAVLDIKASASFVNPEVPLTPEKTRVILSELLLAVEGVSRLLFSVAMDMPRNLDDPMPLRPTPLIKELLKIPRLVCSPGTQLPQDSSI